MESKQPIVASIRWPAELKQALDERARADGRTFSGYVIHVLRQHLAQSEPPHPVASSPSRTIKGTKSRR